MKPIDHIERQHGISLAKFIRESASALEFRNRGDHRIADGHSGNAEYESGYLSGLEYAASAIDDRVGDKLAAASHKARNEAWDAFTASISRGVA